MPSYDVNVHQRARDTLQKLDPSMHERVSDAILTVSECEQPSSHPDVEHIDGCNLLRLRVGDFRVILELQKPNLNVLLLGRRAKIYDNLDVAKQRAQG